MQKADIALRTKFNKLFQLLRSSRIKHDTFSVNCILKQNAYNDVSKDCLYLYHSSWCAAQTRHVTRGVVVVRELDFQYERQWLEAWSLPLCYFTLFLSTKVGCIILR